MKMLVADDDDMSLLMMKKMLLRTGYDVTTANNGVSAVEATLQPNGPRLLLLDWMMPGLNGPDVCRAIRQSVEGPYIYIILLTAKDSKDDLVEGLEAGADDYITKPFHPEELRARLRTGKRILDLQDKLTEARDQMHYKATHDALTLILNRGAIVQSLARRLKHKPENDDHISAILCDVDHFKNINDTHGHPVGDEVLRQIAQRIEEWAQPGDVIGRFGGEEFLLLLREGENHLQERAEALCEIIRSKPMQTNAGALQVTMSAGGVSVHAAAGDGRVDQILQRVDLLLYEAKAGGRDMAVTNAIDLGQPTRRSSSPALVTSEHVRRVTAA